MKRARFFGTGYFCFIILLLVDFNLIDLAPQIVSFLETEYILKNWNRVKGWKKYSCGNNYPLPSRPRSCETYIYMPISAPSSSTNFPFVIKRNLHVSDHVWLMYLRSKMLIRPLQKRRRNDWEKEVRKRMNERKREMCNTRERERERGRSFLDSLARFRCPLCRQLGLVICFLFFEKYNIYIYIHTRMRIYTQLRVHEHGNRAYTRICHVFRVYRIA